MKIKYRYNKILKCGFYAYVIKSRHELYIWVEDYQVGMGEAIKFARTILINVKKITVFSDNKLEDMQYLQNTDGLWDAFWIAPLCDTLTD